MKFEIEYPPTKKGKAVWNKRFGLNAYYAGKHWNERKRDAEELHWIARSAMRRSGIRERINASAWASRTLLPTTRTRRTPGWNARRSSTGAKARWRLSTKRWWLMTM